jgi:hypothetical protein
VSQETANTPPQPCEQLLDYVYGELDEAGRRAFEAHLAECPRCPTELQSFGRVRVASERLMPKVEPSAALTGALHAQLMHAAAQRKPKRGKLLAFPRQIVAHPGWAAAAMFVIVGGAVGLSTISQGPIGFMKARESRPPSAPAVATAPAVPVEREAAEGASPAPPAPPKPAAALDTFAVAKDKKEEADVSLSLVREKAAAKGGLADNGEGGASRSRAAVGAPAQRTVGPVYNGVVGGVASTGAGAERKHSRVDYQAKSVPRADEQDDMKLVQPAFGKTQAEPSVAGAEDRMLARRDEAPADARSLGGGGGPPAPAAAPAPVAQVASPPPSMSSVAQPEPQARVDVASAMPAPAATVQQASPKTRKPSGHVVSGAASGELYNTPQMTSTYGGNTYGQSNDPAIARADKLATSNRCDEAIKLYQDLDRRGARVPGKSRARYVRCLSQTGRPEQALRQLDQLKADKNATSADVQNAEAELRPSTNAPKKKAKSNESYDAAKPAPAMSSEPPPASQPPVPVQTR